MQVLIIGKPGIVCNGRLAFFKVNTTFDSGIIFATDGCKDGSFFIGLTFADGKIGPVDFTACDPSAEDTGTLAVFGNDGKPCGIPVKPVYTAEGKIAALGLIICHDTIGKGIMIVSHGRMNRGIGGFVYEKDVLIFIENIKVHTHRHN